jgi:ATP-dependent DNA helicase RecG
MNQLDNLLKSVTTLPGVSEKTFESLTRLGCKKTIDLLWHLPSSVTHRKIFPPIYQLEKGDNITLRLTISDIKIKKINFKRSLVHIIGFNNSGEVSINYFNFYPDYLLKNLKVGDVKIVAGKVDSRMKDVVQIAHPDYFLAEEEINKIPKIEVIYPLTYGIVNKQLSKFILQALNMLPSLPEWLPPQIIRQYNWPDFKASIQAEHNPSSPIKGSHDRLAFDELLANQLTLTLKRYHHNKVQGETITPSTFLRSKLLQLLPYQLTEDQQIVIKEIDDDLASGRRMLRLVQGDVGSGKTIVAFICCLSGVENQYQTCIMAPTDILANQHFEWIKTFETSLNIKIGLLTGKIKGKKREEILNQLASGELNIIIGTHALFQEQVTFKKLGIIIIDEQHRFGVEQRALLSIKGTNPHILYMTATPIPRTLTMMLYGDIDNSRISKKPKNRLPIKTLAMPCNKASDLMMSFNAILDKQEKIYWVCPLIEDKEESDLAAAESRFSELQHLYKDRVQILHGKMSKKDKEEAMLEFATGNKDILVATTVIEVGINVPEATVMVIEQAERFGLSQLHQLRGRVGRGTKQSTCILLFSKFISPVARSRIKIMKDTDDGFVIAEEDLKLRGGGDLVGTKQSGEINFKIANIFTHKEYLYQCQKLAKEIVNADPYLERNKQFYYLLRLFQGDDDINVVKA